MMQFACGTMTLSVWQSPKSVRSLKTPKSKKAPVKGKEKVLRSLSR
jgi:hypothetical protein